MPDAEREPPKTPALPADAGDAVADGGAPSAAAGPSFGNMSADHWSRARAGTNAEAMDYYRQRSHAPGVEAGGGARNFYCMQCDGVIDFDSGAERCPHCGAELEGRSKRYFNWVEINEPPKSDAGPVLLVAAGALLVVGFLVWFLFFSGIFASGPGA